MRGSVSSGGTSSGFHVPTCDSMILFISKTDKD